MRIPGHQMDAAERRDVSMTPMIDVVFLLLIFFICTASFQIIEQNLPSRVQLEVPAGTENLPVESLPQDIEPVIVHVGWEQGKPFWKLNGEARTNLEALENKLVAAVGIDASVPVILDIAPEVPLGFAIDTYDICRQTGFSEIQFSADVSMAKE